MGIGYSLNFAVCLAFVIRGLAIYIKKYIKKAKEELWKLKYFTMQNIIFKKSSKKNQNPSRY
jgi:hypothetical protein